jgi:hypothetical protein
MKRSLFFPAVILSIAVFLAACQKQTAAPEPSAPEAKAPAAAPAESKPAVTLDGKKLMEVFASGGAEEQSRAGKAAQALQAEAYPSALVALEKLLAEGHLTPEQKALATSFVAQLKQMTAKKP